MFLVDGHSYLYRAFYATPHLSNSKGLPTNAIYAFLGMLKKLIKTHTPDILAIVFDSKTPSFREEIFRDYKAQRQPMPDNLSIQIPYVKRIVQAMGFPILEQEGYEADDIIGTFVKKMENSEKSIHIITSDKDMMQLVSDRVYIFDTMKNILFSAKEVVDKFGVTPSLMPDFLALCGDSSDNIPGVTGIGEKTARQLIQEFGPIEEIYSNIEKIKRQSIREKLIAGRDNAYMSKALATIKIDCPIDIDVDQFKSKDEDTDDLREIYRELEFTTFYNELKKDPSHDIKDKGITLSELSRKTIGIDLEYRGRMPVDIDIERFHVSDGMGVYSSSSKDELLSIIDSAEEIVIHNLKAFIGYLIFSGWTKNSTGYPLKRFFDTMLAAYLINPMRKDYSLTTISDEYLCHGRATASCLPELKKAMERKMEELGLTNLFYNIEMPLVEVLAEMEFYGVRVDRRMLNELSKAFDKRINGIVKDIYSLSGEPFNINSPQQLSKILFDVLKLPPQKKTKTGYSTDTEVLEILSAFHPMPSKILEYRTLSKLKSTYIDVLPSLINPVTGRIHASFNQMVVATGRLSSSDPNLQNIPIRGEEGKRIREAFIPADGYVLLSSDYSQIELRVLAHISKDPMLIDTFLKDEDVHTKVAVEVFGVTPESVTPEMRRTAKVINFGIIYGMSGYGLSKELGISPREAQDYIDAYLARYRYVKEYMDRVIDEARKNGFVRTLFGRIRYMPELNNPDTNIRQIGERAAMNTPIQGTAADIIKIAMVKIFKRIKKDNLSSRLIMQIHDELVLEVKEDEVDIMERIVKQEMEGAVDLLVPLKVSLGMGMNWALAHE
ncbi:MAG: DNA polymerase I [Syntrophorhabdaceae bacterium]|nr:DNA polymerase I [Syntrophorhabdaceae bacterium]